MKTIIIGFSRPIKPTLFSRLIQFVDKTPYDHVYVKWNSPSIDRDIIYQASKLAVNFESNITFAGHAITIEEYQIQISDQCYRQILQFCMDNSNKPYGIKEIIGFGYVKILALFGKTVNNPFPSYGSSFVCSKLGYDILELANKNTPSLSADNIDPLDLNNIINSMGLKKL